MFEIRQGNIFEFSGSLLHGTNAKGVMGKGIAIEFKKRFPEMYKEYQILCKNNSHNLGNVFIWEFEDNFIYNVCIKDHWKNNADLRGIRVGLTNVIEHMEENDISCVAMPQIGCGCGGLNWEKQVKPIVENLANQTKCNIVIYEY